MSRWPMPSVLTPSRRKRGPDASARRRPDLGLSKFGSDSQTKKSARSIGLLIADIRAGEPEQQRNLMSPNDPYHVPDVVDVPEDPDRLTLTHLVLLVLVLGFFLFVLFAICLLPAMLLTF